MNDVLIKRNPLLPSYSLTAVLFFQFLIIVPWTLGFSLLSSAFVAAFVFINVLCGAYAYTLINKKRMFGIIELLGFGVGLGTLIPALINILFRMFGFMGWSTAPIFPIAMLALTHVRGNLSRLHTLCVPTVNFFDLILVLSMAVVGLAAWAQDLIGFLIVLVFALTTLWYLEHSSFFSIRFRLQRLIVFSVFPAGSLVTKILQSFLDHKPIWRSLSGVDVAFDEATSFGVSTFGIFDNALLAGQRTYGHVLTHAWAGDLASFLNSPRFMVTASVGFVVAVIGIAALAFSVCLRLFDSQSSARISLILLFLQGSMPEEYVLLNTFRMAHAISIMWLLLFCLLLAQIFNNEVKYSHLVIGLGVFAITISKVHWGIIAVVIFIANTFWQLIIKRSFAHLSYFILSAIIFYSTYSLAFDKDYGFPFNFGISRNFLYEFGGILFLRVFIGVGIFEVKDDSFVRRLAIVSVVFGLMVHLILAGEYASDYWISFAFIWISIFTGAYVVRAMNSLASFGIFRLIIYFGPVLAGAYFTFYFFRENYYLILINARSWISWFVVSNPELIPLTVVFLIAPLIFLFIRIFARSSKSIRFNAIFVLVAVSFNTGVWFTQSQRVNILERYYDIELTSDFILSDTQIEIGEWISKNTETRAILATNFLCDIKIENTDPFPQTRENDCLNRNTLSWLASIAHRRVLIESPVYSGSYAGSIQQISDYNTSLEYGRNRSVESFDYLKNRDVDYFVFDKANSRSHNLLVFRDSIFENIDYAIVPIISIKVL